MEQVVTDMFGSYAEPVLALMGLIAALCVLLPTPGEDSGFVYKAFYKIANWIGMNFGKAKNADDEKKATETTTAQAPAPAPAQETKTEQATESSPAETSGEGKA